MQHALVFRISWSKVYRKPELYQADSVELYRCIYRRQTGDFSSIVTLLAKFLQAGRYQKSAGSRASTQAIRSSDTTAVVSGSGANQTVGGLVGETLSGDRFRSTINGSYAMRVTGPCSAVWSARTTVPGISNSFATSSVTGGNSASAGGLVGLNANDPDFGCKPTLATTYSIGRVSGGSGAFIGALIGSDTAQTGTTDSYWDLDTSGISNPHQGTGNIPDDPGIAGITDAQLKSGLPADFDPKVWAQNQKINNGDPYLIDNPPPR
jgi:hypothetical protein